MRRLTLICLGSSIPPQTTHIECAVARLSQRILRIISTSGIYLSEPFGKRAKGVFYNCLVLGTASSSAETLLFQCRRIESALGRGTGVRWEDRIIDIDILLYSGVHSDAAHLTIPHPSLQRPYMSPLLRDLAGMQGRPSLKRLLQNLLAYYAKRGPNPAEPAERKPHPPIYDKSGGFHR